MKKISVMAILLLSTTVAFAQTNTTQEDIKAYVNNQITDAVTSINKQLVEHSTTDDELRATIKKLEAQVAELSILVAIDELEKTLVLFAFDSFELSAESNANLAPIIDFMKRNPKTTVTLEGHTDERGTREYNLALGERRANAVANFLASNGISANRITTVSYGKERPRCVRANSSCWAENRRVQPYFN